MVIDTKLRETIYLLLHGDLGDWEREFLKSIWRLTTLSEKQADVLTRIIEKHFGKPR